MDDAIPKARRSVPMEQIDFWRALNPECTITDSPLPAIAEPYEIPAEEMSQHAATMVREGYFQTRPIIPKPELDKLARCMTNIVRWKLRPEYVYLYDEVYAIAARLARVLDPILGSNFQLVPQELGAYFIPVGNDTKGFKPHRDYLRVPIGPNGLPRLVTAWIPLTDATTLNSCL